MKSTMHRTGPHLSRPPRPAGAGRSLTRLFRCLCLICALFLVGCQTELYQGLTEEQANDMLITLMKRGVKVEKKSAGKAGYVISVDEKQVVFALQVLKDNNLPRATHASLGSVFSGQGMISSPTEEQSRLAYAISQELADTFSRIDGVLTSRVHIVLASTDLGSDVRTPPSAAVFLRHLPESQAVSMVPKIRELTANAVPELDYEQVSVMLLPVRETVAIPMPAAGVLEAEGAFPMVRFGLFLAALVCALGVLGYFGYSVLRERKSAKPGDVPSLPSEPPR